MNDTAGTVERDPLAGESRTDRRGSYTARFHEREGWEQRITKWHYVDSEVGDAVLTYCGRKMALKLWVRGQVQFDKLRFFGEMAASGEDVCQGCGEGSLADPPR